MPRKFLAIIPVMLLVAILRAAGATAPAPVAADNLHCEYWVNPLGIDLPQPRLSWLVQSGQRGARQTAYEVLAASSPALLEKNQGDLWDSGQVKSDQTLDVLYAGQPLASAQQIYWKVRVWNQSGQPSAWSAASTWTMGVMNDADWHAHWIGAPAGTTAATYVLARQFEVKSGLKRATVNVCGLGQYEMSLNGKKIGDDLLTPGWSKYDKTDLYDTYDVTALLRQGHNAAGLILGNGMYNNGPDVAGRRYNKFRGSFGPLKAIAQLRLEYNNGQVEFIGTDAHWRLSPGPITFSSEYGGEDYDARLEPRGWDQPDFDATAWVAAAELDGPGGKLRGLSCAAPAIRTQDVLKPVKVTTLRPGVEIYDFGQNASLMPRLQVHGVAGASVRMIPAELLRPDGSVDRSSSGNGSAWWQYTLRGDAGGEAWFPKFFYHGSRYLQVERTTPEGGELPTVDLLEGVVVHSSSTPVGEFACSNDLFNRIRTLIRWAQRSNMVSLITDCPHRERLGWLEQDYLNGPSLRYEFDLAPLINKTMNDMSDSQLANGLVPDTAPEYTVMPGGFRDSPEWGSAVVQCAWQQYLWTGDVELLRRYYEPMKRYVAYLASGAQDNIVNHGLGDWYDLGPKRPGQAQLTPIALTGTAIYYDDVKILEQTAKLIGKNDEAADFAKQRATVLAAFNNAFFYADTGQYATGSQTANALPLALGMVAPDQSARVVDAIVQDVRSRGNALTAGDVGYRYLLRALALGGRSDVIFEMNNQSERPGYGYQLSKGATSLTEAWDARTGSQNHFMLGHIMEWFYHDLAGIQEDSADPGYKSIIIQPAVVGDLTWVKAHFDSVHGRIESEWHRDGGQFILRVTIPPNATATIGLPTTNASAVKESAQPAARSEGVRFQKTEKETSWFAVESGTYTFSCDLPAQIPAKP